MMPISNYKELIQTLNWDTEKRTNERWYIFLVMNPRNLTYAGTDILKNFSYLNVRSENVTLFLPGFSNMDDGVVPFQSNYGQEVVYEDDSFGKLYFDELGFLETIKWLEDGSDNIYRYSEDLDLVILKYNPRYTQPYANELYEQNFDLLHMICYNLDQLKRQGINIIRFIMDCRNAVKDSMSGENIRKRLEVFINGMTEFSDRNNLVQFFNHYNQGEKPIFISYSRNDFDLVQKIKVEIEERIGVDCWMDLEGIPYDSPDFVQVIARAINEASVFLFMLSKNSQISPIARGEITLAKNRDKHIALINIDGCKVTDEFTILYSQYNICDFLEENQKRRLFEDIKSWLGG